MSQEQEGIEIVLSAVQLAAVLTQETVDEHAHMTNRLWGGLRVIGGALELVGAGALCIAPEPTMLSKAGCMVFGLHGADTTTAGARQVWTGQDTLSLTHQGTAALAKSLGADPSTADRIGLSIDIAVPVALSIGLGAARLASVRMGRIKLIEHEALAGSRLGGHTIAKHVGRTEAQLRARLAAEPRIYAASTFTNLKVAEESVSKVMRLNCERIKTWAKTGSNGRLTLTEDMGQPIGIGVLQETKQLIKMRKVSITLKHQFFNGKTYYILTAFPKPIP
jgi:hypothetical protein